MAVGARGMRVDEGSDYRTLRPDRAMECLKALTILDRIQTHARCDRRGPGIGKSTLLRQLGDLYHHGSYGEGEKGVWHPDVLVDIEAGRNPVGVTTYFALLYDANYRDAADRDRPDKVIFFEGARITLEAHMAEYPAESSRTAQSADDRRCVEARQSHRAHIRSGHDRKAHQAAEPSPRGCRRRPSRPPR